MIGRLTGEIVECAPDRVLLDVAGVGYAVQIPLSTYYVVSDRAGQAVSLHVHTHVREDVLQLYGFASREERAAFEMLIGISGVGPRLALAILSGIGADELRHAVREQDRARLQQIPGVGKKTAERLLLELRDRLERAGSGAVARNPVGHAAARTSARGDAVSALTNLGYSLEVARQAVDAASQELGEGASLESLLKAALARLVR